MGSSSEHEIQHSEVIITLLYKGTAFNVQLPHKTIYN